MFISLTNKIMAKKEVKKSTQYPSTVGAIFLAIIITAFIATLGLYAYQRASLQKTQEEHAIKMNALGEQLAETQNTVEKTTTDTTLPESAKSPETETAPVPDVEFPFEKCGVFGAFIYEDWYNKLKDDLAEIGLIPKDASSACYSSKGNMVAVIAQKGKDCEGPKIYKFRTDTNTFGAAKVDDKGVSCLSPLDVFGKRNKYVIGASGERKNSKCDYKDYFEYNYGKNTIELTEIRYKCEGDADWKSTVY